MVKLTLSNIFAAQAWERLAWERSRAEKDEDVKKYRVDMCRVRAEANRHWAFEEPSPRQDPSPLWHQLVSTARNELGTGATERDVREYAARLDWRIPPHGSMPPMSPQEWANARGQEASWLYRKGMSEEGLEKFVRASPEEFYPEDSSPTKVSPSVLIELVRAEYAKAVKASAGAPFIPGRPHWYLLDSDLGMLRYAKWDIVAAEKHRDMLISAGVDMALLSQERKAVEPKFVYVPWAEHFAQALAEMVPEATERAVNQRAAALHYAEPTEKPRPPWDVCMERARMALGDAATPRQIHEYAARVRLLLPPHAGDVLGREEWIRRQVTYLVGLRFSFMMMFDGAEDFITKLATHAYIDAPRIELAAELLAGYTAGKEAEDAKLHATQEAEQQQRETAKAEMEALMALPDAPPIEEFYRVASEYRKSGAWMTQGNKG